MNKKKIIIVSLIIILLLAIIFAIIFLTRKKELRPAAEQGHTDNFTPDILNVEEKTKLGIPVEAKIQAMTRDENGEVTVYKIIKNDSDIIDPEKVESINLRETER